MKELIGKTIRAIELNADSTTVVFETDEGPVCFDTSGDCCSHSWFEHFTNVRESIGKKVVNVIKRETRDAEDNEKKEDQDCVRIYGYSIEHTGIVPLDVEFRNESNGYYGGSCDLCSTIPDDLKELTEDK